MSTTYWRDHYASRVQDVGATDFFRQIGKTVNGEPVGHAMLDRYLDHICATLGLDDTSTVADLGCGNGLVTARMAQRVRAVWGLDYTESLLDVARAHHRPSNVRYDRADLTRWNAPDTVGFAYSIEMLQHLSPSDVPGFAHTLTNLLRSGGQALLCGIPDARRRDAYYDTDDKRAWAASMDDSGTPHMGHWYVPHELAGPLAQAGFEVEEVSQPSDLYTAYYRFDLRVVRP